jgi:homoserine O-acetyltransferase
MMGEAFADAMFGPGDPLDASKYFLIFPDAIGTGGSTKPSDGLRAGFPQYNYDDMVDLQHRVVTEGLGIDHVRLIFGYSMGGMNVWTFGERYPDFADALVPLAALPGPMAGRNWMLRKLMIESVRRDPAWMEGNYTEQPPDLRIATIWFGLATYGGDQALYAKTPTNEAATAMVMDRLDNAKVGDANDVMYQWDSSRDFDPTEGLDRIKAHVLVINSDDDERNPLELGILEAAMPKVANGEVLILPGSASTSGHGTPMQAAMYADKLADWLAKVPKMSAAARANGRRPGRTGAGRRVWAPLRSWRSSAGAGAAGLPRPACAGGLWGRGGRPLPLASSGPGPRFIPAAGRGSPVRTASPKR